MTDPTHKQYLGDGVYVDLEDGAFVLSAENQDGLVWVSKIRLDFPTYVRLERYVAEKMREAGEGREKEGM